MSIASQARALLTVLGPDDFDTVPPAERRRYADLCRHVAKLAEPPVQQPKAGVLYDLRQGQRAE